MGKEAAVCALFVAVEGRGGGVIGCGQCIGLLWERIPLGGRATSMQVHGRHTVATHTDTHIYVRIRYTLAHLRIIIYT